MRVPEVSSRSAICRRCQAVVARPHDQHLFLHGASGRGASVARLHRRAVAAVAGCHRHRYDGDREPRPPGTADGDVHTTGRRPRDPGGTDDTLGSFRRRWHLRNRRAAAGRYQLSVATDRKDLAGLDRRQNIILPNAHACAGPYTALYVNGTISGSVADIEGRPVAGARVSLRGAEAGGQRHVSYEGTTTNAAGQYVFRTLGAGKYVVGVNLERRAQRDSPYAMSVAADATGAPIVIDLEHGGQQLVLPIVARLLELTTVIGRVIRPDGQPLRRLKVRAVHAGESLRTFGDTVDATTDDDGRFALDLAVGQPHRLSVHT
ncbi:MAG: carboxypeptidase regulatory-like domain-containing protein, partial [Alphaproteobacteria bacterium]